MDYKKYLDKLEITIEPLIALRKMFSDTARFSIAESPKFVIETEYDQAKSGMVKIFIDIEMNGEITTSQGMVLGIMELKNHPDKEYIDMMWINLQNRLYKELMAGGMYWYQKLNRDFLKKKGKKAKSKNHARKA